MDDLSKKFSATDSTDNFVPKTQLSLESRMLDSDLKRHQGFFASLSPANRKGSLIGVLGAVVIVLGALSTAYVLNQTNIGTKNSSASADCEDFQVKVYTSEGFTCENCGAGEYGKLDMCEKDSPSGQCEVLTSGCFKPKF